MDHTGKSKTIVEQEESFVRMSAIVMHTWASSKSPGEGVQFFFSAGGGLIFQNRGGVPSKIFSRIS